MVRKGRFIIDIVVEESKIATTKTKIINALQNLKTSGDIESGCWKLTTEEYPEQGTI